MPSPRATLRNGSASFHGRGGAFSPEKKLRRPRTVPDLIACERTAAASLSSPSAVNSPSPTAAERRRLTKMLLNVNVQGSVGPVQVLMNPESSVRDLIAAALKQYLKEGRRPVISGSTVDDFDLHYSQFSLESLDSDENISTLGSRNFFMCKRKKVEMAVADGGVPVSSCSKQAEKVNKLGFLSPWLKFMSFLF